MSNSIQTAIQSAIHSAIQSNVQAGHQPICLKISSRRRLVLAATNPTDDSELF